MWHRFAIDWNVTPSVAYLLKSGHDRQSSADEMYFGGQSGNVSGVNRHIQDDDDEDNKNGFAQSWAFGENRYGTSDSPPHQAAAFMESLLDLQGFCVESKRKQRRQKFNAENNCICLLHQILIKVENT